jgi:NAD(P)H-hydrate epimerase
MRAVEEAADVLGVPPSVLMDHAGRSVAEVVAELAKRRGAQAVLVLVGPGNNGGDGLVAARYLTEWGFRTTCYLWHRKPGSDRVRDLAAAAGVPLLLAEDDAGFGRLRAEVARAGVILDALLGTGLTRALSDDLRSLLDAVSEGQGRRAVVAVDVPSGLNSDTGAVDQATLPADLTVSLGHLKAGLLVAPGAAYAGKVVLGEIGLPAGAEAEGHAVLDKETVAGLLPERRPYSHKGTYGKALVVAGSPNYVGAASLACRAACRAGAGLVSLACAQGLQPMLAGAMAEVTYFPLPEDTEESALTAEALPPVLKAFEGYDAMLVGPGLGRRPGTVAFVRSLARTLAGRGRDERSPLLVFDADGLNALAGVDGWWRGLGPETAITPHAGEMGRLLGISVDDVERDRLNVAKRAAQDWGLVVVLKGAYTVVVHPDGTLAVSPVATAALATAGSGDVLAGALVGLGAQGLSAWNAARAAVYVHGRAGETVDTEVGDRGAVASDLLPRLPQVMRGLHEG